jgi:hypothetical protein
MLGRNGNTPSNPNPSSRAEFNWIETRQELLQERINELQLALEDRGWENIGQLNTGNFEFDRLAIRSICRQSRLNYLKNPIINRGVNVQAIYVWGQGVKITARDRDIQAIVTRFLDDPGNKSELTSHRARVLKECDLQVDGNIVFALFTNVKNGEVSIRTLPFDQVDRIIHNPDDRKDAWFYKRIYQNTDLKAQFGQTQAREVIKYYPDWQLDSVARFPLGLPQVESNATYAENVKIFHMKVGGLSEMQFGIPETYQALDWAHAYKEFLEDWATIVKSLSRFAWKMTGPPNANALAAATAALGTTITEGVDENNPSPAAGSLFYESGDFSLQAMPKTGATIQADDGRRLLLMALAALGIPECYAEDTEVLTDQGFMRHDEWQPGIKVACYNPDTNLTEMHEPTDLRSYYYNGEMIQFKNQQTDILVTPNHRMWTAPQIHNYTYVGDPTRTNRVGTLDRSWRIETAEHIEANPRDAGWRFSNAVRYEECGSFYVETPIGKQSAVEWYRFLGYFISEGHTTESVCKSGEFNQDGTPKMRAFRRIGLTQHEGPVLDDMRHTLDALGLTYTTTCHNTTGVIQLVMYNHVLWQWLRDNCGHKAPEKHLPLGWQNERKVARYALYEALMDGDGGPSGSSFRYSTSSKRLADDMQLLAISIGYGASITSKISGPSELVPQERLGYNVWIRTRITDESCVREKHVTRVPYSGMVHCFVVPHGIYVTRRNGRMAIQGNTFTGDVSVGTLATAESLDRPTELKFRDRQTLWSDTLKEILEYVIHQAAIANYRGLTLEEVKDDDGKFVVMRNGQQVDIHVEVDFPPILERDVQKIVDSIVSASTLDGKLLPVQPIIPAREVSRKLMTAVDVADIDGQLEILYPTGDDPANPV